MNDSKEAKLRNFIETKVYGASETSTVDGSRDPIKAEYNVLSIKTSENDLISKQYVMHDCNYNFDRYKAEQIDCEEYKLHTEVDLDNSGNDLKLPVPLDAIKAEYNISTQKSENDCNYHFDRVICKTEKEECEDNEEYKLHTEVDLDNTGNDLTLPIKFEHIKVESYVKDFLQTECSSENKLIELSKLSESYKRVEECHTSTELIQHKENAHGSVRNSHSSNEEIREIKCNVCGKSFAKIRNLKIHMLIHTEEKPYTCLICNKSFKKSVQLKEHERVHTGEKPYACSMCGKTFSNSGYLKSHLIVHSGEKRYTCGICQKSFLHKNYLTRHIRVHTGEKPYECTVCNERFADQRTSKQHRLIHTGEKPHPCTMCDKSFRLLSTLRQHKRIHTGEKPYSCGMCKKSYRRKYDLQLHQQEPCVINIVENKVTEQPEKT